jgi:hypothetical protein
LRIILKVMKKKLEADLISIAHRILKLKNKEDIALLHLETRKLYEKLSVLLFVEENFGDIKPTIGLHDIEVIVEKAFAFDDKIIVAEIKNEEFIEAGPIIETPKEDIELEKTEIPETINEAIKFEETPIIEIPKPEKKQVAFDDFLTNMQPDLVFERVSDTKKHENILVSEEITKIIEDKVSKEVNIETAIFSDNKIKEEEIFEAKPSINLNDKLNKNINIGLNDKLAFEKELFDGSSEDFNRVVSQISTFDNLVDAKNFIDEMVKPDYNNWNGKQEFADRFMEFVDSKFV